MTAPLSPSVSRAMIVAEARTWIGTPYRHQASARGAGADCLGLLRGVWRALYGAEPEIAPPYGPTAIDDAFRRSGAEPLLAAARRHFIDRADADPLAGDALIFRIESDGPARHCALYAGAGRIIHAYAGRTVLEGAYGRWWRARRAGLFAFPALADSEPVEI